MPIFVRIDCHSAKQSSASETLNPWLASRLCPGPHWGNSPRCST